MKYIKSHPIHENDSHLSQATIISKKAQPTVIGQDREDDNAFQRLSQATKRSDDATSTIKSNPRPEQGDSFQKVSTATEIDSVDSISKPRTDGSYQRLSSGTKIENDTESTYKMNSRPEQGDSFQKVSTAAEIDDNALPTIKQNDRPGQGNSFQNLSDIAESRIISFEKFNK
jgi:hypothetical protein